MITMVVISVSPVSAYEIGFRMATVMGIASALIVMFGTDAHAHIPERLGFLHSHHLRGLFYGGALVITWAVSESVVRDVA